MGDVVGPELLYRPAIADDAGEIAELVRVAYRDDDAGGWTSEAALLADERIDIDQVRAKIARPDAVVLTVRDDQETLIACCEIVRVDSERAYFGMFAVQPTLQAAGIGRQVLTEAERIARERFGAARMEMLVIGQRDDLIAWYVRRGYQRTDERRPFPYDALVNGEALRDDLYFSVLVRELADQS